MKSVAIVSSLVLLLGTVAAWQVDPRCPEPMNRQNRQLEGDEDADAAILDEMSPEEEALASDIPDFLTGTNPGALRGQHRDLADAGPDMFALKMYWEAGFCWQEEFDLHRKWCWECKGNACQENQGLWWQKCDSSDERQQFSYLPSSTTSGEGQFKWAHANLCLHKVNEYNYLMKRCSNDPKQIIRGFKTNEPFELLPKGDDDKCVNQHHHPKAGEIVENTRCRTARYWKTNLMELVSVTTAVDEEDGDDNTDSGNVSLRDPQCTTNKKCNVCQGDCDKDSHCKGNLVCFQRRQGTKNAPVPGCGGDARTDRDYCINPALLPDDDSNTSDSSAIPYQTPVRTCTPTNPCGRCEGDCDKDSDCMGTLECFQKDGAANIPGCIGSQGSKTDFCYDPRM